ncbi:MAG TPA: PepSY domain-containing protein [Steroidobacteraceae bacterium]
MKNLLSAIVALVALHASGVCLATGLATCDSGPQETWQPQSKLEKQLTDKGWQVRRIKIDGGCYEVYAINEKGERVEAYFHPQTLEPVPTKKE